MAILHQSQVTPGDIGVSRYQSVMDLKDVFNDPVGRD
jgi:hypothetical protein